MLSARLDHPDAATREQLLRVETIIDDLGRVAAGVDAGWNLSGAMASIAAHYRHPQAPPITEDQRDRLLIAVVQAQLGADEDLPETVQRSDIELGMWALAAQVTIWAEPRQRVLQRSSALLADVDARARILQNCAHNVSLAQEIGMRAADRRAAAARSAWSIVRNQEGRIDDTL
jgi:hypothetical protein